MADINLTQWCVACQGTGVHTYTTSTNGQGSTVIDNPCLECGGDGLASSSFKMESTYFDEKFEAIQTKINYVYSKTDNIINKLNDIKDKVDQIWDKVK